MVMLGFSIPDHIAKIKDGSKAQTTRNPRKTRSNGKPAYSIGEKVQLYYRPRMASDCRNCLWDFSPNKCAFHEAFQQYPDSGSCCSHTNFFGESEIIDIIHYHKGDYKERHHEVWMGHTLELASKEDKDAWAIADGFLNGYIPAHDWFYGQTGNHEWADQNLDVIVWQKDEIIKGWQSANGDENR